MSFEITPVGGVYRCNGIEFRFERQALLSRVILSSKIYTKSGRISRIALRTGYKPCEGQQKKVK